MLPPRWQGPGCGAQVGLGGATGLGLGIGAGPPLTSSRGLEALSLGNLMGTLHPLGHQREPHLPTGRPAGLQRPGYIAMLHVGCNLRALLSAGPGGGHGCGFDKMSFRLWCSEPHGAAQQCGEHERVHHVGAAVVGGPQPAAPVRGVPQGGDGGHAGPPLPHLAWPGVP